MCDLSSCIAQKEARLGTEGLGGDSPALEQVEGLPLSLLSLKTRPIGWDAWHFLSSRRNILITLIRNEGVSTLLVLNAYFAHLYEEEERADREGREPVWPAFPRHQMSAAARRGLYNSAIDYTVQCTRAVLDLAAVRRLPPALSSRLVRDLRAAVARAAALPWHRRAPALLATSLLSEASLYAADAAVAACVEAWGAARWYLDGSPPPGTSSPGSDSTRCRAGEWRELRAGLGGAQPAAEAEEADELAALVSAAAVCNVMLANDGFVGQAPSLG
ncbi:hypothetical protein APUTEX25_005076 [Auxenochlorella protothecoides]|uniref:Uncharacterized protein n=1 Tax=Auxenochlorella protothecoides TaxID=3075 RepID=A0A3M7KP46_AUXPR|nr:hypothetical protein APUTEX25_005076 [Auxenochlorella protothecoides]|eukprot:RMZ52323.1 hypothetical protein APUTEX25_005076 [Auxenochlorella protothecoides]